MPKKAQSTKPALVCIDEERGYVKGNIMIVSQRAATLIERLREMNVTASELRHVADFFDLAAQQKPRTRPTKH